jgi:hypothetical protein
MTYLHAMTYDWHPDRARLLPLLTARLQMLPLQDLCLTLKALGDEFDQVQQQKWFTQRLG